MIKLKSLIETRIIEPEESLLVGDITLYHGTDYRTALKAKKEGLNPIDKKEKVVYILMMYFDENREDAEKIFDKYNVRKNEPNVLFFTTKKESAIDYAKYTSKWQGEITYDILKRYFIDKNVPKEIINNYLSISKPALITITVPLSMVLTHPHWETPARKRIYNIVRQMKKHPEIAKNFNFAFEVFVREKIPAKYIQRIDRIYESDI